LKEGDLSLQLGIREVVVPEGGMTPCCFLSLSVLPLFGSKAGTVMVSAQQSRVNKAPAFWPED